MITCTAKYEICNGNDNVFQAVRFDERKLLANVAGSDDALHGELLQVTGVSSTTLQFEDPGSSSFHTYS